MRRTKNWEHAAGILWPVLVKAATERRTFYYSELSPLIGTNPLSVGKALGPIQDFCLDHDLPPLTAIVIGKVTQAPGGGFIAWDIQALEQAFTLVFETDWSLIYNPFSAFGSEESSQTLADLLLRIPEASGEVYRLVKDRGISQRIFKKALLKAYDHRCAFCDMSFGIALEGAHIIPWSLCTPEQKLDVRNGLLLCATHHRLFDGTHMTITVDFRIQHYDPMGKDEPYYPIDKALSTELHGKRMRLPTKGHLRPNLEFIAKRRRADSWDEFDI